MVCNDPSYDLTKHNPRQMSTGLPPSGEYLGGETIGGTSRSTPIAFAVTGWTNGLLVSICACLAHMYTWRSKVGHISAQDHSPPGVVHVYTCAQIFFQVLSHSCMKKVTPGIYVLHLWAFHHT